MINPFDAHFADIQNVKASGNNNYVMPGVYRAKIDSVTMKRNRKQEDIFVIQMTVLEIVAPISKTASGKQTESNPTGTSMSHVIKFAGPGAEMALPNIKGFCIAAIDGFADASNQTELIKMIYSDAQPLAGQEILVEAVGILTKRDTDFTQIRYSPAPTSTTAE